MFSKSRGQRSHGQAQPKQIDTLPPGTHGDGNNLYLVVKDSGARAWMIRYHCLGRQQKMGLGSARDVTLAEARDGAIDANRLIARNVNPREARDQKPAASAPVVLFGTFAEEFRLKREAGYKHKAHKAKWERTVQVRARRCI